MIDKIRELIVEAEAFKAQSKEEIEAFRIKYLGKKGLLTEFYAELKHVANDQKKEFGQIINELKNTACLLYTSPSPRDRQKSRMPSSA